MTRDRVFELRQCYARALQRTPRLRGDLLLGMMLDRNGAVVLVQPLETPWGSATQTVSFPARTEDSTAGAEARGL